MGPTPYALYPGPALSANEVAVLSGPVATVDGVDVSRQGTVFSLLPGCHVVMLQSEIGEGGVSGAWSEHIRRQAYVFHMRAGNSYVIDVRLLPGNHSVGTANVGGVKILAFEQDGSGKKLASIAPARKDEIAACQAEATRPGAAAPGPEPEATDPEAKTTTPEVVAPGPKAKASEPEAKATGREAEASSQEKEP
jgi:hypothetical protein